MTLAYLVTKEIQLDNILGNDGDTEHFQAFPGTMYLPSLEIQLVLHQEGKDRIVEYNRFDELPGCSLRAELAAILEHARDSVRKIDVNGADAVAITNAYRELGETLKVKTHYLFNSPQ